jgi:hypothetical protein
MPSPTKSSVAPVAPLSPPLPPDRATCLVSGHTITIHLDPTISKRLRSRAGRRGETDALFADFLWHETLRRALESVAF